MNENSQHRFPTPKKSGLDWIGGFRFRGYLEKKQKVPRKHIFGVIYDLKSY